VYRPAGINNGSFDPDILDWVDTATRDPSGPYSVGTTDVTLTVADNHGAIGTCTAPVTVTGCAPVPSIITVAAHGVVAEATGQSGAIVTFDVTATDALGDPLIPTCAPASGSIFAIVGTTVTCTASDAKGDVGTGGSSSRCATRRPRC
jgi:hypothetical protein